MSKKLRANHYSVDVCLRGDEVQTYLRCADYDALILDIMLPGKNGLEVLREIRLGGKQVPVLLLTARDSIEDRVIGLDAGADDYLIKPFAFDEFLARVRVLLRHGHRAASNLFAIADLTVDCAARTVRRGETAIDLPGKEFALLEYLIRNQGVVLTREQISNHIWNYDYEGGSNVVDVYIRNLRRKFEDGSLPKLIHTVRGTGYVLREER
jgi:DNA-binding response OmpR family regulator